MAHILAFSDVELLYIYSALPRDNDEAIPHLFVNARSPNWQ